MRVLRRQPYDIRDRVAIVRELKVPAMFEVIVILLGGRMAFFLTAMTTELSLHPFPVSVRQHSSFIVALFLIFSSLVYHMI